MGTLSEGRASSQTPSSLAWRLSEVSLAPSIHHGGALATSGVRVLRSPSGYLRRWGVVPGSPCVYLSVTECKPEDILAHMLICTHTHASQGSGRHISDTHAASTC